MKFQRILIVVFFVLATNAWGADKAELIDSIAKKAELTQAGSQRALDAFISSTSKALQLAQSISLVGVGTFTADENGVSFAPDRPLVKAVAYDYLHTFWGSVILVQTKAMMKVEKLMNDLEKKRPGEIEYVAFPSMGFFAQELGNDTRAMLKDAGSLTGGDSSEQAVVEQMTRASEIFAKQLAHEAAHVVQQRSQSIIKAAGLGLQDLIKQQALDFLDPKSPNLGLTDQQFKEILKDSALSPDELIRFLRVLGVELGRLVQMSDSLDIEGFGSFEIPTMAVGGRNPETGKEIIIPARKVVSFKAGGALAETVKNAVLIGNFKGAKDSVIQNIR